MIYHRHYFVTLFFCIIFSFYIPSFLQFVHKFIYNIYVHVMNFVNYLISAVLSPPPITCTLSAQGMSSAVSVTCMWHFPPIPAQPICSDQHTGRLLPACLLAFGDFPVPVGHLVHSHDSSVSTLRSPSISLGSAPIISCVISTPIPSSRLNYHHPRRVRL